MWFKEKSQSMQFRLFMVMCISTVLAILILIAVNNLGLETFYKYSKAKTIINICEQINSYYNREAHTDIKPELKQVEISNNIEMLIINESEEMVYESNRTIFNTIEKSKNNMQGKILYKKENIEIKDIENFNNSYIVIQYNLDNGYIIYTRFLMTPIQETIHIFNSVSVYIGCMMILILGLMSSIVSRKFTEPIVQLNKITKKMAKLDFSEKYIETSLNDEVDTLGKNINEMSNKLEATIGQLRKNNNQLERDIEEKSKIDEMRKQFISDVSHELKTPISLIQGYAEGLKENVNEDEESRRFYTEVILDESKKMDKMVKELLELMKLEYQERKLNNTEFDLNELIREEIRRETVVLNEKAVEVEANLPKKTLVLADQDCIQQVVNNYFTNAIKHCETAQGEKKITFKIKEKMGKIRLYVFNTGKNIPEENINKIWGRFYKSDSSRSRQDGGTGIGLALVKAIMNNYGNDYGVKNLENGVEFYCDIPTPK